MHFLSVYFYLAYQFCLAMQLTVKWALAAAAATLSLDAVFPCFISGQDWPEIMSSCTIHTKLQPFLDFRLFPGVPLAQGVHMDPK